MYYLFVEANGGQVCDIESELPNWPLGYPALLLKWVACVNMRGPSQL